MSCEIYWLMLPIGFCIGYILGHIEAYIEKRREERLNKLKSLGKKEQ